MSAFSPSVEQINRLITQTNWSIDRLLGRSRSSQGDMLLIWKVNSLFARRGQRVLSYKTGLSYSDSADCNASSHLYYWLQTPQVTLSGIGNWTLSLCSFVLLIYVPRVTKGRHSPLSKASLTSSISSVKPDILYKPSDWRPAEGRRRRSTSWKRRRTGKIKKRGREGVWRAKTETKTEWWIQLASPRQSSSICPAEMSSLISHISCTQDLNHSQ